MIDKDLAEVILAITGPLAWIWAIASIIYAEILVRKESKKDNPRSSRQLLLVSLVSWPGAFVRFLKRKMCKGE
jgi:hypothetical protein